MWRDNRGKAGETGLFWATTLKVGSEALPMEKAKHLTTVLPSTWGYHTEAVVGSREVKRGYGQATPIAGFAFASK